MKGILKYLIVCLTFFGMKSQNTVLCRMSPDDNKVIQVKWYSQQVINVDGFNVYRQEVGSLDWEKLNKVPIKHKDYKISDEELKRDTELKAYMDLAASPSNMKDIALLATLIKSFKSDVLCKYLGIRFDDASFEQGKKYFYKINFISKEMETELGVSKEILATDYQAIEPPKNILSKKGNKKVSFTWEPESDRFFGVNIYRKTNDTGSFYKITKDPILLSKTKNSKGEDSYGEEFYVDGKLKPHTNYYYQFEALDFFGSPSTLSKQILITLKDHDPPKSPDSLYYGLDGKKVFVKWKKKIKEDDLLGFNIYRTNKNDTDFVKVNKETIPLVDTMFLDQVTRFGSYMYAVSCIDKDSNETVSNPFHIKVYDNEPPKKPENLTIQADSGKLVLRWNENKEEDLNGYLIYRTINKNEEDTYVKMTPTPIKENIYTDALPKNIKNKFLYKVVAVDLSLNRSPYSEFAIARMPDVTAPNVPFLKSIYANEKKQVLVEWLSNAEPDLAGYNIYRKNLSDSSASFKKLNVKLIDGKSFRYTDRYVAEETVYEYYLEAVDSSANCSKNSNHNKFKLRGSEDKAEIKISQFEVNYNVKRKHVVLTWKLKNEESLKGSVVYKLKSGENVLSPISGSLLEGSLLDSDVTSGSEYVYQLRVYNQRGDAYRSEKVSLTIK